MPTYDYVCGACAHAFEQFQTMSAKKLRRCPKCKKQALERLVGTGAGLIFKGTGFYITDYRKPGARSTQPSAVRGEAEPGRQAGPEGVAVHVRPGRQGRCGRLSRPRDPQPQALRLRPAREAGRVHALRSHAPVQGALAGGGSLPAWRATGGYPARVSLKPPDPRPAEHGAPPGRCPICGGESDPRGPTRPFCGERCKWVDLGRWLKGDYRVPGTAEEPPPGMGGEP
jgi:putative FmdB family regulatory protein